MIKLPISDDQLKRAENLYPFEALKESIMEGKSNIYGAIGEIIVMDYYDGTYMGKYDYDLLIASQKVDVKTKRTTVEPKPSYYATISKNGIGVNQKCDYYCFVRVLENKKSAYILGFIKKEDFFKQAFEHKIGEPDASSELGWKFKSDGHSLEISKLTTIDPELLKAASK